jgi:hypothetical protein
MHDLASAIAYASDWETTLKPGPYARRSPEGLAAMFEERAAEQDGLAVMTAGATSASGLRRYSDEVVQGHRAAAAALRERAATLRSEVIP